MEIDGLKSTEELHNQRFIDPAIFAHLQAKIDEDSTVREELRSFIQNLEKQGKLTLSILSRAHATRLGQSTFQTTLEDAHASLFKQASIIRDLGKVASKYPYYKYNSLWTRELQNTVFAIVLYGWLGGLQDTGGDLGAVGHLLPIEEVGNFLGAPVDIKDRDEFHLTIEEYLHALITLIEELARLAVNAVTLGDFRLPLTIRSFVKDLHAAFQILNLKNDSLRRRSDSVKYNVKRIEDVVYDITLRQLVPRESPS